MPTSLDIEKHIAILFKCIGSTALPAHGYLSKELSKLVETSDISGSNQLNVSRTLVACFATAAVEMWLRGVHSFLISAVLTNISPLWASVSGYYSSHYCVRGLAHLCGIFHLHKKQRIIKINIDGGKYCCNIDSKHGGVREHKYYWRIVKEQPLFKNDPFFTTNADKINDDKMIESDLGHRNFANYSDHLNRFPNFRPFDEEILIKRISIISKIQLSSVPIPRIEKYPDTESVQLIAYHRLIIFRKLLDNILGGSSKFWTIHRTPTWCNTYIDFQVTKPSFMEAYKSQE